jgi:hypothetical protein
MSVTLTPDLILKNGGIQFADGSVLKTAGGAGSSLVVAGGEWVDKSAVRFIDVEYTNSSNTPIEVSVYVSTQGTTQTLMTLWVDSSEVAKMGQTPAGTGVSSTLQAIIPVGSKYKVKGSGRVIGWFELIPPGSTPETPVIPIDPVDPYAGNVIFNLLCEGDAGSNTFTDKSNAHVPIRISGDVAFSNDQAKFGGSSIVFPHNSSSFFTTGDGIYGVSLPSPIDANDFCLEFWAYNISGEALVSPNAYYLLALTGGSYSAALLFSTGPDARVMVGLPQGNQYGPVKRTLTDRWVHYAITRNSGSCRLYVDGHLCVTWTDNFPIDGTNLSIGTAQYNPYYGACDYNYAMKGFFDGFRISRSVSRYTPTDIKPNVAQQLSAPRSYNSIYLQGEGVNDSKAVFDTSGNNCAVIVEGTNAGISTVKKKFGTGSLKCGQGNVYKINIDYAIKTVVTLEAWVYLNAAPASGKIAAIIYTSGNTFGIHVDDTLSLCCFQQDGTYQTSGTTKLSIGAWQHVAVSKDLMSQTRLYIDGNLVNTPAQLTITDFPSGPCYVGSKGSNEPNAFLDGYIDNAYICLDQGLYYNGIVPPTSAF